MKMILYSDWCELKDNIINDKIFDTVECIYFDMASNNTTTKLFWIVGIKNSIRIVKVGFVDLEKVIFSVSEQDYSYEDWRKEIDKTKYIEIVLN
jgi:hypothetical protein